jgi:glycosyltransferase involved in cell wall biosynthesis
MPARAKTLDILVVSDLWPPHVVGGYELGARDVAARLAARGHGITVLTSTYGVSGPCVEGHVHRLLYEELQWRPLGPRALLAATARSVRRGGLARRFLRDARFDVVHLFNPLGLSARLLQDLLDAGRPVVAYVSDHWVTQWPWCDWLYTRWMTPRPARPAGQKLALVAARRVLRRLGALPRHPDYNLVRHAQFVSRFVRALSVPKLHLRTQEIIPWGIDVARFPFRERRAEELGRWVYVGQLEEHKGAHVAIDAVAALRARGEPVTLTLVGRDTTAYAARLRTQVAAGGLEAYVRFTGPRDRDRLVEEAYDPAGLLVFPTLWEEPFSLTLLEAFASGLPVVTTVTGGTGELVRHGVNATVITRGSAQHLAAQYLALRREPERALGTARRARRLVEEHLDLEHMVDRVEAHLLAVTEGRGSCEPEAFTPRPHPWEPADTRAEEPTGAIDPDGEDGAWLAALLHDVLPGDLDAVGPALATVLRTAIERHPRHGYLASDERVQRWLDRLAGGDEPARATGAGPRG